MSLFREFFNPQASALTTAQYMPTPGASFPPAAAPTPPAALPPPPDASAPAGAPSFAPSIANTPGGFGPSIASLGGAMPGMINNHALTLMALGAGIAQGGVGKGLAAAEAAAQAERSLIAQQVSLSHVYGALTNAGVPADEALAAVANPSLMRTLAVKYLGPRAPGNAAGGAVPALGNVSTSNQGLPSSSLGAANLQPSTVANAPALPPGVPIGARYSPTRQVWRDPSGNRFDPQGRAIQ